VMTIATFPFGIFTFALSFSVFLSETKSEVATLGATVKVRLRLRLRLRLSYFSFITAIAW